MYGDTWAGKANGIINLAAENKVRELSNATQRRHGVDHLNQIKSNLHARGQPIWAQVIVGNLPYMYNTVQTPRATSDSQCKSFSMSAEMNEVLCEV